MAHSRLPYSSPPPKKLTWQERCYEVERFHKESVKLDAKHTMQLTATELQMSVGAISEYLQLAIWMRTDPRTESYERLRDALLYMKKKKEELRTRL